VTAEDLHGRFSGLARAGKGPPDRTRARGNRGHQRRGRVGPCRASAGAVGCRRSAGWTGHGGCCNPEFWLPVASEKRPPAS